MSKPQPVLNVHLHRGHSLCCSCFLPFLHFSSSFLIFMMQQEEECEKGQSTLRDTLMSFPWAVKEPQQNLSLPLNKPWVQYKSQSLKVRRVYSRDKTAKKKRIHHLPPNLITGLFLNSLYGPFMVIQQKTTVYKIPLSCILVFGNQHQCTGERWFFFFSSTFSCLPNEQNRALIQCL